ncbi:uncharacterized protein CDAR_270301, partial [Caerostris darwini]
TENAEDSRNFTENAEAESIDDLQNNTQHTILTEFSPGLQRKRITVPIYWNT